MNNFLKAALVTGVLAAISAPAYAVGTGLPFTVNDGAVPGVTIPNNFVTDSFDFSYKATIIQAAGTGPGGLLLNDAFTETGSFEVSSYKLGTVTAPTFLNAPGFVGGYGAYGLFSLNGTATFINPGITASFLGGALALWVDPNQNTVKNAAGVVTSGGADDLKVGDASLLNPGGEAHLFGGLANGDFEVVWGDWLLTGFGSSYWSNPTPFHTTINLNGNTTSVLPAGSPFGGFKSVADGSGNAFFASTVPEPGSLALLGIGLLGFGAAQMRKRKSA